MAQTHIRRRRSGTFYYRRKIPGDLRIHFGKTEIVLSLRTNKVREASAAGYVQGHTWTREFARVRAGGLQSVPRAIAEAQGLLEALVAYRISQLDTDLHDADYRGLSAARRFCFAYEAARHAATACLGEMNVDHRDDIETFAIIAAVLNLNESAAGTSANMVRLYRAQMHAIYEGVTPVDMSAVGEVLHWAHIVVPRFDAFWKVGPRD